MTEARYPLYAMLSMKADASLKNIMHLNGGMTKVAAIEYALAHAEVVAMGGSAHGYSWKTLTGSTIVSAEDAAEQYPKETKKKFVPPTIEEVIRYVASKGMTFNPSAFWNHYEAKGWKIGKNPMVKWHAACATWQAREEKEAKPKTEAGDGWFVYKGQRYRDGGSGIYYTDADKFGTGEGYRIDGTHRSQYAKWDTDVLKRAQENARNGRNIHEPPIA